MSIRKLKTPTLVTGEKVFCAPFVMMAVTGKTHDQVCRSIRKANNWGDYKIQGMYTGAIVRAFNHMGYNVKKWRPTKKGEWVSLIATNKPQHPTLARWIDERTAKEKKGTYMIMSYEHVILISGNMFIDTKSKVPVKLDDCPYRRMRVVECHEITGR